MLHLLVHVFGPVASVASDQSLALESWPLDGGLIRPQVPDRASLLLRHASGLPPPPEANRSPTAGHPSPISARGAHGRTAPPPPHTPLAPHTPTPPPPPHPPPTHPPPPPPPT